MALLAVAARQPIEEAVEKNDRKAVSRSHQGGRRRQCARLDGDTPLMLAAKTGQSSSAQALIEGGADIKVRDDAGNGVLHYAAQSGMTGICGLLIDRGIAVDDKGAGWRDATAVRGARRPPGNREVSGAPRRQPRTEERRGD